jgi:hypothetical protein
MLHAGPLATAVSWWWLGGGGRAAVARHRVRRRRVSSGRGGGGRALARGDVGWLVDDEVAGQARSGAGGRVSKEAVAAVAAQETWR